VDHELENFEDSIIMMRNLPAVLSLDIAVFVASILVNVLGEPARKMTAEPFVTHKLSGCPVPAIRGHWLSCKTLVQAQHHAAIRRARATSKTPSHRVTLLALQLQTRRDQPWLGRCRAGVYVTVYLGSVFRAVLTVTRTGFIWLVNVALFYSPLGHHRLGESVSPLASSVQLIGFALTVGGTVLYAQGTTRCVCTSSLVGWAA